MLVDNEVFEAKAFENEPTIGFYGGGESFANRVKSYDGCYVE